MLSFRTSEMRLEDSIQQNDEACEFNASRYEPMAQLLADDDFLFLQSQPGYTPEIGKKFRSDRRRIFRGYLAALRSDFNVLHTQARALAAGLPAEYAPLIGNILRQQRVFTMRMVQIEFGLALDRLGLGSVNAGVLVDMVSSMQSQLSQLAAPSPA